VSSVSSEALAMTTRENSALNMPDGGEKRKDMTAGAAQSTVPSSGVVIEQVEEVTPWKTWFIIAVRSLLLSSCAKFEF
jgi:hypothetical protein